MEAALSDLKTTVIDAVHKAEAAAANTAQHGVVVTQSWLRRNVWGVMGVAVLAVVVVTAVVLMR